MGSLQIKTYEKRIHKPQFPGNRVTLAFLSDFHNGKESVREETLALLAQLQPDMVCIGGDMLVGKPEASFAPALSFVKSLAEQYPVIYAYGNHEFRMCLYADTYKGAGDRYQQELEKLPLTLLRNTSVTVSLKGMDFRFTGLEIPAINYKKWRRIPFSLEQMKALVGENPQKDIEVLLAHNPVYWETYSEWKPDIVLSGHMHGGIVRLLGRPLIGTDGHFFPKWGYGRKDSGECSLFVSAGLGEHTIPLRLWNPRELVVITITNEI